MGKLIGYARVSTRNQSADRQVDDLLSAGVRRDDLYVDHGVSGARARRPQFDLGGANVDTSSPTGSMVFTVMAALAQMELEIKRERITDSVTKRRSAGGDLGGRRPVFTDSQIRNAQRLVEAGEPASQVARDLGMSRATLYRRIATLS